MELFEVQFFYYTVRYKIRSTSRINQNIYGNVQHWIRNSWHYNAAFKVFKIIIVYYVSKIANFFRYRIVIK